MPQPFETAPAIPVAESLGPGVVRYFRDEPSRRGALPSYSILGAPAHASAPGDSRSAPVFGRCDAREAVQVRFPPGTCFYATGEVAGPLLRNGRRITCWNTDAYAYAEGDESLYQSHPWVLCVEPSGAAVGLLADTTYRCDVDTGYSSPNLVRFVADGPPFALLVIEGEDAPRVLARLATLVGTMPLPPMWALGYHQCRYSYASAERVREVASGFRSRHIPADVLWLDIDYMNGYRVFTWDRERFPDPAGLCADLHERHFRTVCMLDPGLKAEPPTASPPGFGAIMRSGDDAGIWVLDRNDRAYEGPVWPGNCRFPDFTSPTGREWWGMHVRRFLHCGADGIWNDMNEPAVFSDPDRKTMPLTNRHAGDPGMTRPDGAAQGAGAAGDHARYHNVYALEMARATRDALAAARPHRRPFVLTRAGCLGSHRVAATWTGDNTASWPHLELSVPMVLNLGLSAQPFAGPDIGGFIGDGSPGLFRRWMGIGALLPFARGHSNKGTVDKEPWAFDELTTDVCREALRRRYRLLPYLYTLFELAHRTGQPVIRPVFFADKTDASLRAEDAAFLLGSDVLVLTDPRPDAPRLPRRPRGVWREFDPPAHRDLPRTFLRAGAIVPTGPDVESTAELPADPLVLWVALDESGAAEGFLYEDDADGYAHREGRFRRTRFVARTAGGVVTLATASVEGDWPAPARRVVVRLLTERGVIEAAGRPPDPITLRTF